jgi:hypothetical protein
MTDTNTNARTKPKADISIFNKGVMGLITLTKTIIRTHTSRNLDLSHDKNPILSYLEQYEDVYSKTPAQSHVQYFKMFYDKYRDDILNGTDSWLRDNRLVIHYSTDPNVETDKRLYLSAIYSTACKIRREIEDSMDGLPDVNQSKEMLFSNAFLLHLYRTFKYITALEEYDLEDCIKVEDKIHSVMNNLGLNSDGSMKDKSKDSKTEKSEDKTDDNKSDPLSALVGTATDVMRKMGLNIPAGAIPKGEELTGALSQMFNNPQAQNMFGNIFKQFTNSGSIGDVMQNIVKNIGDPKLTQAVNDGLVSPDLSQGARGVSDFDDFAELPTESNDDDDTQVETADEQE